MRFIRFQLGSGEKTYGWLYEDRVGVLEGTPFGEYRRQEAEIPSRLSGCWHLSFRGKLLQLVGIMLNMPRNLIIRCPKYR